MTMTTQVSPFSFIHFHKPFTETSIHLSSPKNPHFGSIAHAKIDQFIPSLSENKVLALSCKTAQSLKPALMKQQYLIEAMSIPYPIKVFLKNKEGVGSAGAISASEALEHLATSKAIALGDLHGSPLKLLETMVTSNLISMPVDQLKKMTTILQELKCEVLPEKELDSLHQAHLKLKALIPEIQWTGGKRQVILIGDVLGDRGPSDSITMDLIEHLEKSSASIIRLASNHDHDVIPYFNSNFDAVISPYNANSVRNAVAVAQKMGTMENLKQHYAHYLKQSKLMHFDSENKVMYMHAPVDKNALAYCLQSLKDEGYPVTPLNQWHQGNIADCVEELNMAYQDYAQQHIHKANKSQLVPQGLRQKPEFFASPFFQLVWNRTSYPNKEQLPFNPEQHGIELFVHGHDSSSKQSLSHFKVGKLGEKQLTVVNTDNNVWKGSTVRGDSPVFAIQA
jgi:hypothetical protein